MVYELVNYNSNCLPVPKMARLRVFKMSLVLLVLFCKFTWLCHAVDSLDAKAFSQALSKLVREGLGVTDLQVWE